MTVHSVAVPEERAPARVFPLPPEAFASKWPGRPRATIQVGLALVSPGDIETAKTAAGREAWRIFPRAGEDIAEREEVFQDVLVRWLIARGTCDPKDVTKPVPIWREAPEDIVREALSSEGAKALWDALELYWFESSPVLEEIDDEGIYEIAVLTEHAFSRMPESTERRVRRMLSACLAELRAYSPSED